MGSINSQIPTQTNNNEAWISLNVKPKRIIGQPFLSKNIKTHLRGYQYIVDLESDQFINRQISIYEARKTTKSGHLIKIYAAFIGDMVYKFGRIEKKKKILRVISEQILWSLADYYNLSNEEGLYIIQGIVNGCQELIQYSGLFRMLDSMIGMNDDGKVKIWLNSNFSRNIFQIEDNFPKNQGEMIASIFKIVQKHLSSQKFPQYIKKSVLNSKSFKICSKFISSILCSKYSQQIGINMINKMIIVNHNQIFSQFNNQNSKQNCHFQLKKGLNDILKERIKQSVNLNFKNQNLNKQTNYNQFKSNPTQRQKTPKYYQSLRHSIQSTHLHPPRLTHYPNNTFLNNLASPLTNLSKGLINHKINYVNQSHNTYKPIKYFLGHFRKKSGQQVNKIKSQKIKKLDNQQNCQSIYKQNNNQQKNFYQKNTLNLSKNVENKLSQTNLKWKRISIQSNLYANNRQQKIPNFQFLNYQKKIEKIKTQQIFQQNEEKLNISVTKKPLKDLFKKLQKPKYHEISSINKKQSKIEFPREDKDITKKQKVRSRQKKVTIKTEENQSEKSIKDNILIQNDENKLNKTYLNKINKVKRCCSMEAFKNIEKIQGNHNQSFTNKFFEISEYDHRYDKIEQQEDNNICKVDTKQFIGDKQLNLFDYNLDEYSKRPLTNIEQQYYEAFLVKEQKIYNPSETSIGKIQSQFQQYKQFGNLKTLTALMKKQVNSYEEITQIPEIQTQQEFKNISNHKKVIKQQKDKTQQFHNNDNDRRISIECKNQQLDIKIIKNLNIKLNNSFEDSKRLSIIEQTQRDMETAQNFKSFSMPKNLFGLFQYIQ